MIIHKGYQFKLDPTPQQAQQFRQFCGAVRWVWNHMLADRNETYHTSGKSPSTADQIKQLPRLKRGSDTAWLGDIHSQVLQDAVLNLDEAFQRFFAKQSSYPKFKKKHGPRQSFSYPQGIKVAGNTVFLPKIGWVVFRRSHNPQRYREIEGEIKRATVRYQASGWYVSLVCEIDTADPKRVAITEDNSIGLDLGSIDLVVLSDGRKLANPRHYRRAERKLKRAQRRLSRKQRGSHNYAKQQQKVAKLHETIANRRLDALHHLSYHLVSENQALFVEDLNVKGIAKQMGKSVGDTGWGELVRQLKYKAHWAGKQVVQIGRFYPSSQKCSHCGFVNHNLERDQRIWVCPNCGTVHDRDVNAAVNIKREGLRIVAAGQSETENACGELVRPAGRARLREARISRL